MFLFTQVNGAMTLYQLKDPKHKVFKFNHCWEILKEYPKWSLPVHDNLNDQSSTQDNETPTSGRSVDGEVTPRDGVRPGSEGRESRGRQATKTSRRLATEKDPMWQEMMNNSSKTHKLLEQQLLENSMVNESRLKIEQEKIDIKREKYACKQRQMDMREAEAEEATLGKCLAEMTPYSKAYWSNKKQAIVDASARKPRASRNLNFGAGGSDETNVGEQFSPLYSNPPVGTYCPDLNNIQTDDDVYGEGIGQWSHH